MRAPAPPMPPLAAAIDARRDDYGCYAQALRVRVLTACATRRAAHAARPQRRYAMRSDACARAMRTRARRAQARRHASSRCQRFSTRRQRYDAAHDADMRRRARRRGFARQTRQIYAAASRRAHERTRRRLLT
jgi:hypothetical protein